MSRILLQIILEFFSNKHTAKRPSFQTLISWDIFKGLYKKRKIKFATFFSNHIANIMHRYWDDIFYKESNNIESPSSQKNNGFCDEDSDDILRDVILMNKSNKNLKIFFLSGMVKIKLTTQSMRALRRKLEIFKNLHAYGLSQEDYTPLLAMVPQIAINITKRVQELRLKKVLVKTLTNKKLFSVLEEGNSLSISILTPEKRDILDGVFIFSGKNDKRKFSTQELKC